MKLDTVNKHVNEMRELKRAYLAGEMEWTTYRTKALALEKQMGLQPIKVGKTGKARVFA